MCNAYIRYTVNGKRHSAEGAGVMDCLKDYYSIYNEIIEGNVNRYRFIHYKEGDIVKVELFKRRPTKNLRASFEFKVISNDYKNPLSVIVTKENVIVNNFKNKRCPICGNFHVFLQNTPCKKCGHVHNTVRKIGGFTNWDDDDVYEITCGNILCGNKWSLVD